MTSEQISINCTRCKFLITQEIIFDSAENYIYCPSCDNVFPYNPIDIKPIEKKPVDLVEENFKKAYNEIPHTFIRTEAIFLKGHINGQEINFLLDTGAEMSVIPANIIQACGLESILDTQYSGVMKGVGEAKTLGRVHYVEVVLECGVYPCSFSVCSNNDLPAILGIDMMYNLGISIDFKKKQIHFDNGCSVGFINRTHDLTPN
jgi:hypothetical protein